MGRMCLYETAVVCCRSRLEREAWRSRERAVAIWFRPGRATSVSSLSGIVLLPAGHRAPLEIPPRINLPQRLRQILELVEALQGAVHHVLEVLVGEVASLHFVADVAQEGDQVLSGGSAQAAPGRSAAGSG